MFYKLLLVHNAPLNQTHQKVVSRDFTVLRICTPEFEKLTTALDTFTLEFQLGEGADYADTT